MIVLDTNVVSELMRPNAENAIWRWADRFSRAELAISAITVQEIEFGISKLPLGRKRSDLEQLWRTFLMLFDDRILPLDAAAAQQAGRQQAFARAAGRAAIGADIQIAGICLVHGAALATRNVKDFDFIEGLELVNPFEMG